ncbi:MAG: carboxypeptidase-like regulatory domain-containing protein [Planctomycetota bacterium]
MRTYSYAVLVALILIAGVVVSFFIVDGSGPPKPDPIVETPQPEDPPEDVEPPPRDPVTKVRDPDPQDPELPGDESEDPTKRPPLPKLDLADGDSSLLFRVLNSEGERLPGVSITLRSGRRSETQKTNADGELAYQSIGEGSYSYFVESEGRPKLTSTRSLSLEPGVDEVVELQLEDYQLIISGRVLSEDGEAVPDVQITAIPRLIPTESGSGLLPYDSSARAKSGPDGDFVVEGLQDCEYEIRTQAVPGFAISRGQYVKSGIEDVVVKLERVQEIRIFGTITDESGEPISGARVLPVGQTARSVLSDDNGEYEFTLGVVRAKTKHLVRFAKPDFSEEQVTLSSKDLERVEEHELSIVLREALDAVVVSGVVTSDIGEPVEGETVRLHSQLARLSVQGITDEDGRYQIDDVAPADDYRIFVRPSGAYRDYFEKNVDIRSDLDFPIELKSLGRGTIRGKITDSRGTPIPEFTLRVQSALARTKNLEITSDASGVFELRDVPEGKLIAETRSEPRLTISGIELKSDENKEIDLIVDTGDAVLHGTVVDQNGQAVSGARVYLTWSYRSGRLRSGSSRQTLTDVNGTFRFPQLGPGKHRLNVNADGFRSSQASYDPATSAQGLDIRLQPR